MIGKKYQQISKQLKTLTDPELKKLIKQLTYGKNMQCYNIDIFTTLKIVLYLYQTNPYILVAIDQIGKSKVLEIRQMKVKKCNRNRAFDYSIAYNQCISLSDYDQQIILLFQSQELANNFHSSITKLLSFILKIPSQIDSGTMKIFIKVDTNNNLLLSLKQIKLMFNQLKLNDQIQITNILNIFDLQNKIQKSLKFNDFQILSKILTCRKQLIPIFHKYTGYMMGQHRAYFEKVMDKNAFAQFITETQKQNEQFIQKILKQYFINNSTKLSFYDFCTYLNTPFNNITDDQYYNYQIDRSKPFTSYLCYTSDNTHLTPNQLTYNSNNEQYFQDISTGVRCVDIFVTDGQHGPIVKLDDSSQNYITFQQALQQISKAIAGDNHSPIIISISNHCNSQKNQKRISQNLKKHFNDKILHIQNPNNDYTYTLNDLMNKILINSSNTHQNHNSQSLLSSNVIQQKQPISQQQQKNNFLLSQDQSKNTQHKHKHHKHHHHHHHHHHQKHKKGKTQKPLHKQLLSLISIFSNGQLGKPSFCQSVTLSQNLILQHNFNNEGIIKKHCEKGWIRSYPDLSQANHSTCNPLLLIEMGVQMLGISTQISDQSSLLLKKYFEKGIKKTAGYRLKPLLPQHPELKQINITPLSASKIYFNNLNEKHLIPPCQVRMKLYCWSADAELNQNNMQWKQYTEIIKNNSFNPVFKKRRTMNIRYTCEQLTFILIQIREAGTGVIPLQYLKKGYRTVALYDNFLQLKDSKIFVNIQ